MGLRRQWICFPQGEVPMDKHGETQGRYIWRPSNKRIHEGPNVWWNTEWSWTVRQAVTEVSSYKLPGKPWDCGNMGRKIEELLKGFYQLKAQVSVKLHFLWSHLGYFPKNCGDASEEQGECFHQDICIMEECYQGWWDVDFFADYYWHLKQNMVEVPEKTFYAWIAPFVYFTDYYSTMWAFCEYISPKFSIICLIQQENSYNTVLYISSQSLYLKKLIWIEKNAYDFWIQHKNCLTISYYIFDLENIAGQCNKWMVIRRKSKWQLYNLS